MALYDIMNGTFSNRKYCLDKYFKVIFAETVILQEMMVNSNKSLELKDMYL